MDKNGKQKKVLNSSKDAIKKLKEIGLKEISNKTFINKENLEHLLNKDFKKLHKTKALGFIQILEREFEVDLKELKNEYIFFKKHGRLRNPNETKPLEKPIQNTSTSNKIQQNRSKKRVQQRIKQPSKKTKKEFPFKLIPIILLPVVALLGYFLIKSAFSSDNIEIKEQNQNIVKEQKSEDNLIQSSLSSKEDTTPTTIKQTDNNNDIDLNDMVSKMLKDINDSTDTKEDIKTSDSDFEATNDINKTTQNIQEKTDKQSKEDNNKDNISKKLSSTLQEIEGTAYKEMSSKKEVQNDNQEISNKSSQEVVKKKTLQKKSIANNLYIVPTQKAWVGVIYIDDLSKRDYLIRANKKLKLDPSRDQIILVGHNKFKIFNNNKKKIFGSKKMVRFLYQNGNLREINKQEYLDLSAGVHW